MRDFFRKVGFGIGPDEKIPGDPLKWALGQLDEVPHSYGREIYQQKKS